MRRKIMTKYIGGKPKVVGIGDPLKFVNTEDPIEEETMTNREKARQNLSRETIIAQMQRLSDGFKHQGDEFIHDILECAIVMLKDYDVIMNYQDKRYEEMEKFMEETGCCCKTTYEIGEIKW